MDLENRNAGEYLNDERGKRNPKCTERKLKKVIIEQAYFCSIPDILVHQADKTIGIKLTGWIRGKVNEEFGVVIKSPEDFEVIDEKVCNLGYLNRGEWVREKLRDEVKNHSSKFQEIYCYRYNEYNQKLFLVKDMAHSEFGNMLSCWDFTSAHLYTFDTYQQAKTYLEQTFSPYLNIQIATRNKIK